MADRVAPDDRVFLKVKLKSLAEEARIIRIEERKRPGPAREALVNHRKAIVRKEARWTHLAYGFLRGRRRDQIERKCREAAKWPVVWRMIERYGPRGGDLKQRFERWQVEEEEAA